MSATVKIKDLKKGNYFRVDGILYEYYGVYSPCVEHRAYAVKGGDKRDLLGDTKVDTVSGFETYLLQGGRDWD